MAEPRDFIREGGVAFFAHRLRRLSEMFVEESGAWLPELGITAPPRAASTLLLLGKEHQLSVTDIANRLRLSHPLIIQLLRALRRLGLIKTRRDPKDARRRLAALSDKGEREAATLLRANRAMANAYREIFAETGIDFYQAVELLERACERRRFADRLSDRRAEAA